MITICVVLIDSLQEHIKIMLDSVLRKTELVSEVLIAKIDSDSSLNKTWMEKGIKFHMFGHMAKHMWFGHPLGLHACIDRATNDYLMFCDPDIFFYSPIEKLYLDLMHKYGINYIGCSHHASVIQAYTFFPCVVCSMVKKSDLPNPNWMKGQLKYRLGVLHVKDLRPDDNYELADGKYLIESPLPMHHNKFPNKNPRYAPCYFDTACNLWLWSQEKNWKYLSFQTTDCHTYSTTCNRGNLKIEKLPKQKLIYHTVGGSNGRDWDVFTHAYEQSKEAE